MNKTYMLSKDLAPILMNILGIPMEGLVCAKVILNPNSIAIVEAEYYIDEILMEDFDSLGTEMKKFAFKEIDSVEINKS